MKTYYDCEPTLSDGEVLDLCKRGYIRLEAVVPEEVNARARAPSWRRTSRMNRPRFCMKIGSWRA